MTSEYYSFNHRKTYPSLQRQIAIIAILGIALVLYLGLWQTTTQRFFRGEEIKDSSSKLYPDSNQSFAESIENFFEEDIFCGESNKVGVNFENTLETIIYFVTPTYARPVQIAELTRLGQTLTSIPSLHWILVEDAGECSSVIENLLRRLRISYTHLASPMPDAFKKLKNQPRGVSNRRAALRWLRNNVQQGVLYFGDDDNTYDFRLFDEIRDTQSVSMFPVGLVGEYAISAPVVEDGKVVGFYDSWPAGRQFPVDMAGFAVNIRLLHQFPNATMTFKAGYEEDGFLRDLGINPTSVEPKASNCTEILVWHTQSVQVLHKVLKYPSHHQEDSSSSKELFKVLEKLHLVSFSSKGKSSSIVYFANNSSQSSMR